MTRSGARARLPAGLVRAAVGLALVLVPCGLLAGPAGAREAGAQEAAAPAPTPPAPPERLTFVLVHGAWGGAWDWATVDSLLTAAGHRVRRPTLTGLGKRHHLASPEIGLETHVTDVVNEIVWEGLDEVVLVGHSYGGMVITGAADRVPDRIRTLVYVDALLPDSGESFISLFAPSAADRYREHTRDGLIHPSWRTEDGPPPHDTPQPARTFSDPLVLRHGRTALPGHYILTEEPGRTPDAFRPFADRAADRGWPVEVMEAGHVPERTHPEELVARLLDAARPTITPNPEAP